MRYQLVMQHQPEHQYTSLALLVADMAILLHIKQQIVSEVWHATVVAYTVINVSAGR